MALYVLPVKSDEFGVVEGSGFALFERGKRIDWPMLVTRSEANADLVSFKRELSQLASDEASERRMERM